MRSTAGIVLVVTGSLAGIIVAAGLAIRARTEQQPQALVVAPSPAEDIALALPDFSLTERSGKPITRESLLGQPTIVGFVFTRCPGLCPMVSGIMAGLRQELPDGVRLLSISVDPTYDTPEVLQKYADAFKAPADTWWFATGDRDAVYSLIEEGFRLPVAENPDAGPGEEIITHTPRLALVDANGQIRGYFDSRDHEQVKRLRSRVQALVAK